MWNTRNFSPHLRGTPSNIGHAARHRFRVLATHSSGHTSVCRVQGQKYVWQHGRVGNTQHLELEITQHENMKTNESYVECYSGSETLSPSVFDKTKCRICIFAPPFTDIQGPYGIHTAVQRCCHRDSSFLTPAAERRRFRVEHRHPYRGDAARDGELG